MPIHLQIWKGMRHVFAMHEGIPETLPAREEIVGWIEQPHRITVAPDRPGPIEVLDMAPLSGRITRG